MDFLRKTGISTGGPDTWLDKISNVAIRYFKAKLKGNFYFRRIFSNGSCLSAMWMTSPTEFFDICLVAAITSRGIPAYQNSNMSFTLIFLAIMFGLLSWNIQYQAWA